MRFERLCLVLFYRYPSLAKTHPLKLYPDKLADHLSRQTAPVYLLYGDEPFQLMQLGDQMRAHAKASGFEERQVIHASDDSDWALFRESADSMSLFSERRIIELRMQTGKPGRTGGEVLKQYCANPAADVLLIISAGKLDRSGTSSAWFKAIDKVGVTIGVWPIAAKQLLVWLKARLQSQGLQATPEAIALIAERTEGNLLAANQEVERLSLLYPEGQLSAEQVLAAVADSARYSINDLTEAALAGRAARCLHVLEGLRDEAVPPVLVLWSLNQEIRSATRAAEAIAQGVPVDKAIKGAGVWASRIPPLKNALSRHDAQAWLKMLSKTSLLDRQIKGQASGNVWDSFAELCLLLAGIETSSNQSLKQSLQTV